MAVVEELMQVAARHTGACADRGDGHGAALRGLCAIGPRLTGRRPVVEREVGV